MGFINAISPITNYFADGAVISNDSNGNVFVLGKFQGILQFNQNLSLTSGPNDGNDIFIVKISSDLSTYIAAINVGSPYVAITPTGLTFDSNNNLYITGYYINGSLTIGRYILPSTTVNSGFIASIDNNLTTWINATSIVGGNSQITNIIYNNSLYVTGEFSGSCLFGNINLKSGTGTNVFVAQLNTLLSWINVNYVPTISAVGLSMVVYNKYLYVAGLSRSSSGPNYAFIYRLNINNLKFNLSITASTNSTLAMTGPSITVDSSGNIYLIANYVGNVVFGSYSVNSTSEQDMIVASFDSNLNPTNLITTSSYNSTSLLRSQDIIFYNSNLYIICNFKSGFNILGTQIVAGNSNYNLCILKINNFSIVNYLINSGTGNVMSSTESINNALYITGNFNNNITFGNYSISSTNTDVFIVEALL
ncbi:MAG: hypothetical protein QW478_00040 [Candidatus Micrarchaeaceae archaeon]